ncbi:MAG: hypothetical protein IKL23_02535 [Oscillospiraceae bacterium]|nr:hypothetical protein [Oscillospiraceae bacterium]
MLISLLPLREGRKFRKSLEAAPKLAQLPELFRLLESKNPNIKFGYQ